MIVDRTGATRVVILTRKHAIKLPNFLNGWKLFLHGLLANMQERQFSTTGWPELCPVVFSTPGGWLVVMRRARPMSIEEFHGFDVEGFCDQSEYRVPAESKASSFGYLEGRIVALDYGS